MARRRFIADPDFEFKISQAVSGIGVQATGRSSVNRRRVTLEFVAQQIVEEAKNIVDESSDGLPGTVRGGRRNPNYDFRRSEGGRTYRSSFKYRVEREGNRLVFIIYNDHDHALDVEYGTNRKGQQVVKAQGRKRFTIPISRRAMRRIERDYEVRYDGKRKPPVGIAERGKYAGQPVLFVREFRTYGGYGILRRAMRRVTAKYLE